MDWNGLVWIDMDWIGWNWIELDWIGLNVPVLSSYRQQLFWFGLVWVARWCGDTHHVTALPLKTEPNSIPEKWGWGAVEQ